MTSPEEKEKPDGEPHPKYPKYIITRNGEVWSTCTHRYLTLKPDSNGYMTVSLKGSKLLHRVVSQIYLPNPHNLPEVNHKDRNPKNNCVDNLEWITRSDNALHAQKNRTNRPGKRKVRRISLDGKSALCSLHGTKERP